MKTLLLSTVCRRVAVLGIAATAALIIPSLAQAEGVPALNVTGPNGSRSVLLGTMHQGNRNIIQPSSSIFDNAKVLAVEAQRADAEARGRSRSPEASFDPVVWERLKRTGEFTTAPWVTALTAAERETLRRRAACRVGEENARFVFSMRPSAADVVATPCPDPGVRSRDDLLSDLARQRGLPIISLDVLSELEAQRDAVMRQISDEAYIVSLKRTLSEDGIREIENFVRALNTGDYDSLRVAVLSHLPDPRIAAIFERHMLCERNAAWIPRLSPYLQAGGAVVMVGAGHLPGPCGLIVMLRQAGFSVVPTLLPSSKP